MDLIYTIVAYLYGPLLGLFGFGIFTKHKVKGVKVSILCLFSPIICFIINLVSKHIWNYTFGYELLLFNGLITFVGLYIFSLNADGNKKCRICNEQHPHRPLSADGIARVCFHRTLQRGQVEPHQHAHPQAQAGHDIGHTGQDDAHQPLPHQQGMVPRRPPRLRLCPTRQEGQGQAHADHRDIHPRTRADDKPLRAHRHTP